VKPEQITFLGLDTSAYTTSLAIVDGEENLLYDRRQALPVKPGSIGIRQSDAVFLHMQNIPQLLKSIPLSLKEMNLTALAFSGFPRPVENSYMPVFKVGESYAQFLARVLSIHSYHSTHQEGHLSAAKWSAGLKQGRYLLFHLSGGTTEIIDSLEMTPGRFKLKILASTEDLNAGQFIDRLGVKMGFSFPAGPQVEAAAKESNDPKIKLTVAVKEKKISFSGPASQAERMLENNCNQSSLSRAIEMCIADSMIQVVKEMNLHSGLFRGIIAFGGVIANQFIRERIREGLKEWKLYFAEPHYSTDNAVGLAVQAGQIYRSSLKV